MKTTLILTAAALLSGLPGLAEERSVNLSVPGMFCASCPYVVQAAIGGVEGVISVSTDLEARTALVVYDDATATVQEIREASASAGYEAAVIEGDPQG